MSTEMIDEVRQALAEVVDRVEAPEPDEVAIRRRSSSYRRRHHAGVAGIAAVAVAAVAAVVAVVGVPGNGHDASPAGPGEGTPPAHDLGTMPIMDDGVVGLLDLDTGSVRQTKIRLRPHSTATQRWADGNLIGAVPGGFLATDAQSRLVRVEVAGDDVLGLAATPAGRTPLQSLALSSDGDVVAWVGNDGRLQVRSLSGSTTGFGTNAFAALHDPRVYAVGEGHVVYAEGGGLWLQSASGRVRLGPSTSVESAQIAGHTLAVLSSRRAGGADHAELYDLARPKTPIAHLAAGTLSPDGNSFAQVARWHDDDQGPRQAPVLTVWHRGAASSRITGVPNVSGVVWLNGSTVLVASNADPAEIYDPASTAGWDLARMRACDATTGGCRSVWKRSARAGAAAAQVSAPLQWHSGR